MKKLLLIAIAFCTFTACDDDDNSELWDEVKNQGNKIEMLESEMEALKLKIEGLNQTFKAITEMLNGGLITNVEEVTDPSTGKTGLTFTIQTYSEASGAQINTYTIWNGTDGKDGNDGNDGNDGAPGSTPQIGMAKEEATGLYYWTLNGEPMKDADGKLIYTSKAPKLRISDDGSGNSRWEVSYDDGATWTNLGVFTGSVVSSSIQIDVVDNNVVIKQEGKADITIPIVEANNLKINFTNIDAAAGVHVTKDGVYFVEYTLENASANAIVKAEMLNDDTNFEVENLPAEKKIKVTAKGQLTSDVILVHVYDGGVCMHTSLTIANDLKVLTISDPKPVVSLDNENVTYEGKLVLDQPATTDIILSVVSGSGTLPTSNFSNLSSSVTIGQGQTTGTYSVTVSRTGLTAGQAYTLPITLTVSGEVDIQGNTIIRTPLGERVDFQDNTIAMIAGQFVEISLQESMLSSQYTGEGSLGNLCNGVEDDFWGSSYSSGSCPAGDATYGVYIDITLSSALCAVKFDYCTRHNNANAVPKTIVIGGSNDGSNWTKCFTITEDGLPTEAKVWWNGDPGHGLGASYSHIRFGVTKSALGDLIKEAYKSTALSELKVYGLHE